MQSADVTQVGFGGGGGSGEGGGGGDGGGGEGEDGGILAQMVQPSRTIDPSDRHDRMSPAAMATFAGPFRPE